MLFRSLARETEAQGTDAKAEALLELIYKLQQEENDPALKVLVFTEFVATQAMLAGFLESRGFAVMTINGGMGWDMTLDLFGFSFNKPTTVPEPTSLALVGLALAGAGFASRRRKA